MVKFKQIVISDWENYVLSLEDNPLISRYAPLIVDSEILVLYTIGECYFGIKI